MKRIFLLIIITFFAFTQFNSAQGFDHFITAKGNKLMDGDKVFRFISFNIPTLNYVEDEMSFTTVYPYRFPTEFEIRDALESVKQMGGTVVRIYTLPVRNLSYPENVPTHITGPGEFNEDAFRVNDLMLSIANETGVRIIFSLLNNWKWMGGRPQYAAFRGKTEEEFWTDPQLIEDFKKTVEFTLNRTNTITGKKYKDDKAIMCWETGNELVCPHDWTVQITHYLKSLDENHLVLDGYHAIDAEPLREESVLEPSIDIVHSHYYEVDPEKFAGNLKRNLDIVDGRKPYIIGEFGFLSTSAMELIIDAAIKNDAISGALVWGFRSHREESGFYWHSEPLGLGIYKSYHWPGFASGMAFDERNFLEMYRRKAFEIRGLETPAVPAPETPQLLPIKNIYGINWKGSVGASGYNVERAENEDGQWQQIAYNVSDATTPYFPLFHDKSAEIGKKYFYRVSAINASGVSGPSNIIGPVKVEKQALIDNMVNAGVLYSSKNISVSTGNDRAFKEDPHRMKGESGSEIIYKTKGSITDIRVYSFEESDTEALKILVSKDGINYNKTDVKVSRYNQPGTNYYGFQYPVLYENVVDGKNISFVKLVFENKAELARVEVFYR